jgi:hypothetical protein
MIRSGRILSLALGVVLLLAADGSAQGPAFGGRGFTGSYGPGMENLLRGGGAGYLPSGGGFVPYTPGPGGGLGVQSRMGGGSPAASPGAMAMPGGAALGGAGATAGGLSPLAPIGRMGARRGGMGMGRLPTRSSAGRGMGGSMARPPVGSYPFRIPPSLLGPATQAPAMAM